MNQIIMIRADRNKQTVELIDHSSDYAAISETLGYAVVQSSLDGDIVALTPLNAPYQVTCTWEDMENCCSVMLIAARRYGGLRSLTAKEINKILAEFGGGDINAKS